MNTVASVERAVGGDTSATFSRAPISGTEVVAFWVVTLSCALLFWLNTGLYLDDAYVYLRVGENMARTGAPVFNSGDVFNITTSPIWTLATSLLALLSPANVLPALCKGVFVFSLMAAAYMLSHIARPHSRVVAMLSALPVFFSASMPTLVGMETGLCLFTAFGLILSYARRDRWTPVWAALCYLSRPEGIIIAGVIAFALLAEAVRGGRFIDTLRKYAPAMAIAAGLIVLWHGWFFLTFHTLMPATANAKTLQGHTDGWTTFAESWPIHIALVYDPQDPLWFNLLRVPVALLGLGLIGWRCWPLIAWPVVHYVAFALLGVAYYHWYYYPIELVAALSLVVGIVGLLTVATRAAQPRRPQAAAIAAMGVAILATVFVLPNARVAAMSAVGLRSSPAFTDGRYPAYAELSRAMSEATGAKPFTLLSHEIGIFGFLMPSASVRDVVGLATPVTSSADLWDWGKPVATFNPDFLLWPFPGAPQSKIFKDAQGRYVHYALFRAAGGYTLYSRVNADSAEGQKLARAVARVVELEAAAVSTGAPAELFDVGGEIVLFAHAPATFVLSRPQDAAGIVIPFGYRPDAWLPGNAPDGARFVVADAETGAVLFQRTLDPVRVEADRGAQFAVVPTKAAKVQLSIETLATSNWDWTYFGAPVWLTPGELAARRAETAAPPGATATWDGRCPGAADIQAKMRAGLGGWLDEVIPAGSGRVKLRGWAADVGNNRPVRFVVALQSGRVIGCGSTGQARPDVAAAQNAPALASAGFLFEIEGQFDKTAPGGPSSLVAQTEDGSYLGVGIR